MIYFTSDLHFGHKNVVQLCGRPFADTSEMNERLIENWNSRVGEDDTVYIIGDIVWQTAEPTQYIDRLNGHKILIVGNHDVKWLSKGDYTDRFEQIAQYLEVNIDNKWLTLCHYPMVEWKHSRKLGSRKLGYHIYGHIHEGYSRIYHDLFLAPHALNAGVDVNNFMPVTFDELVANNERFKLTKLPTLLDKAIFIAGKYNMYRADKTGKGYIEHLRAVADGLDTELEKTVGYLYDILENTDISPSYLREIFPAEICDMVEAIAEKPDDEYSDYMGRIAKNPVTRKVMWRVRSISHT